MDLTLNTATDIVKLLCDRLRKERPARQMTQADVATRLGVGMNTVSSPETGKNVGFENLIKVVVVLGYDGAPEGLSKPRVGSLDDILRYEKSAACQRIKRRKPDT